MPSDHDVTSSAPPDDARPNGRKTDIKTGGARNRQFKKIQIQIQIVSTSDLHFFHVSKLLYVSTHVEPLPSLAIFVPCAHGALVYFHSKLGKKHRPNRLFWHLCDSGSSNNAHHEITWHIIDRADSIKERVHPPTTPSNATHPSSSSSTTLPSRFGCAILLSRTNCARTG